MFTGLLPGAVKGTLWKDYQNFGKVLGMSDKQIYNSYVGFSGVPFLGSFLKASDSVAGMADYMGNRGISYGDIKYPTATVGAGLGSAVSSSFALSKTLFSLY